MIIFLADLQNSRYRYMRNSIPLGMGYVAAYLKKKFGDEVELHLFRKFEEIHETLKEKTPDLLAMGSYCWNTNLTLATAKYLKEKTPEIVTAIGGADVSPLMDITKKDLRSNNQVDFYLPMEGEGPLAYLVEAMLGAGVTSQLKNIDIKGCFCLCPDTKDMRGQVVPRFEGDINEIPSPYFSGLMDRFLEDVDYMPSIQTSRGCPYRCTYCASGKDNWNKIIPFETARVKEEIDYLAAKSRNPFMRFCDENFGLLPRDLEIAEYLVEKKRTTGFPQAGSIYTDKHPTERVKKIAYLLRDIIPFCISYQSATPKVLENIKRVNLNDSTVLDAIQFVRKSNMILVSELIFGLPGETVDSFLASVDKLISFRFESMEVMPLQILKGTEMDTEEHRAKFSVKTMYAMAEKGYTRYDGLENIEIDEFVVANNSLTEEEHFEMLRFIFLLDFAHYRSFLKEFLFFLECRGIKASELLMNIIKHPELSPILSTAAEKYEISIRNFLKQSREEVIRFVKDNIDKQNDALLGFFDLRRKMVIDFLKDGKFVQVVEEIEKVSRYLYQKHNGNDLAEFNSEINAIKEYTINSFIPIHYEVPETIHVETSYNFKEWIGSNYKNPLGQYKLREPMLLEMKVRGYKFYEDIWKMKETALTKYWKAFRIFTSANRRRILAAIKQCPKTAETVGGSK